MRGRRAAVLLVGLLAIAGCEERERANPFDPSNPDTGGIPFLLDARAAHGRVDLVWETGGISGIGLARVFRREAPDGPIVSLTPGGVDPALLAYTDQGALDGVEYEYRLEFELSSGTALPTRWDQARPGPEIPWVADSDGGGLARLTPDGRDLVERIERGRWFLDLAADTVANAIWSADYLAGKILKHASDGGSASVTWDMPQARAVALGAGGERVVAGSFGDGRIEERDADGRLLWSDATGLYLEDLIVASDGAVWVGGRLAEETGEIQIYRDRVLSARRPGFGHPVAMVEEDRAIIVLDARKGSLFRFALDGSSGGRSDSVLVDPRDLCPDGEGGVWVADRGRAALVRFDRELKESASVPLPGVLGITRDARGGRLWAAGEEGIHVLDRAGSTVSRLALGPRAIKVELLYRGGIR